MVAINVGDLSDRETVSYTMLGLAGDTLDAMMRASSRRALVSADVVINVPLKEYGSLDWRRAAALIEEGYRAAEAMREQLLPLAVERSRVPSVAGRSPGAPADDVAGARVRRARRIRHERRATA